MKKFTRIIKLFIVIAALGICLTGFLVTFSAPASVDAGHTFTPELTVRKAVSLVCAARAHT